MKKLISLTTLATISITLAACNTNNTNSFNQIDGYNNSQKINSSSINRNQNGKVIPGKFIVKFKNNQESINILSNLNAKSVKNIPFSNIKVIEIDPVSASGAFNNLKNNPAIEYIEPDRVIGLDFVNAEGNSLISPNADDKIKFPNDERFKDQYAHNLTNSVKGWEITKGDKEMLVAIIDTGIDGTHPEFKDRLSAGYNVFDIDKPASSLIDEVGHGTHSAGIIAAGINNKIGVTGFAPDVKLQSIKALDSNGQGSFSGIIEGITWAAENKAKVLSISVSSLFDSKGIADAVQIAQKSDVLIVAPVGNHSDSREATPAKLKGVLKVAASDATDKKTRFSSTAGVPVLAPGVKILSTFPVGKSEMPDQNYGYVTGTSSSAHSVAGLAALVRSKYPKLKYNEVISRIQKTTDDLGEKGIDNVFGHGRINVFKALSEKL